MIIEHRNLLLFLTKYCHIADECPYIWTGGESFGDSRINSNWYWNISTELKPVTYVTWATAASEPDWVGQIQDKLNLVRAYNYKWGDKKSSKQYCFVCEYSLE